MFEVKIYSLFIYFWNIKIYFNILKYLVIHANVYSVFSRFIK